MYAYYELIVSLYVGANTFWIFDFSYFLKYPITRILLFLLIFMYFGLKSSPDGAKS